MTAPVPTPVITYPRDAILDTEAVGAALSVSKEIVDKMDLPCFYAGKRPRYIWGMVLDALEERSRPAEAPLTFRRRKRTAG